MNQQQAVTTDEFTSELQEDLGRLTAEHPKGITFRVLQEEYGETISRILKVTTHLAALQIIRIFDDAIPPYILPYGYEPQSSRPYQDLTELQRRLFLVFVQVAHPSASYQVKTSYAQVSRLIECSTGGAYNTLDALEQKGYLKLVSKPEQGKANSVIIQLDPDKIAVAQQKPS